MEVTLFHYLIVAAALFTIGVFGIFVNRKNVIIILMSIELVLLSVNINLVAFSAFLQNLEGQIFAMMVLTVAAAEAAVGLAILVTYFRNRGNIAVEDINQMTQRNASWFASLRPSVKIWLVTVMWLGVGVVAWLVVTGS